MEWADCGGQRRRELAEKLGLDSQQVERTIGEFNDAVQEGEFDASRLDGKGTRESRAAQEQLGLGHRHAALFGVPGYGRNHLYLRRAEDKHAGAGVGHGGQADFRSLRCR